MRDAIIRKARSVSFGTRRSQVAASVIIPDDSIGDEVNSTMRVGISVGFDLQGKEEQVRASIIGDGVRGSLS